MLGRDGRRMDLIGKNWREKGIKREESQVTSVSMGKHFFLPGTLALHLIPDMSVTSVQHFLGNILTHSDLLKGIFQFQRFISVVACVHSFCLFVCFSVLSMYVSHCVYQFLRWCTFALLFLKLLWKMVLWTFIYIPFEDLCFY